MAVREFNAVGHYVQWGIGTGGLTTVAQGAFTVVAIAKLLDVANDGSVLDLSNAGTSRATYGHDTANMRYLRGSFQEAGGGPVWTTGNAWCLVAWTKASGTVVVRFHKCILSSETWTHQNSSGTVDNDDNTCTFASTRLNNDNDFVFRGRIAALAVYNSVLNDVSIEGLRDLWADWLSASPIAAWRFDQSATSSPIDDQTAGGANQTTLAGSTVINGDDPPGFSFGAASIPVTASLWRGPAPGIRGPTSEPRAWLGVPAEAPEPITGDASVTEEDDTVVASGTSVAFQGTVGVTEDNDTLAASGTNVAFVGTLAVTEGNDALAASGTVTPPSFTGTVGVTEQDDTLSASGNNIAFHGGLSVTEQDDTLAASGTATPPSFTGTINVTEQDDTLAASGTHTPPPVTGSLAETEDDDTLAASGTHTPPPITGTLSVTEQDDTLSASGTYTPSGISGTVNVTEQDDTLSAAGTVTPPSFTGTVNVTEANDTVAGSGTVTPPSFTGTVSVTEQNDTLAAAGTSTPPSFTGTVNVTEANDTVSASGTTAPPSFTGTVNVTEADDVLAATGTFTPAPITGTLAVTEQDDTLSAAGQLADDEPPTVPVVRVPALRPLSVNRGARLRVPARTIASVRRPTGINVEPQEGIEA